jgi:hypothetical protein
MSHVFKRRHVENIDEVKAYITSQTICDENLDPLE